MKKYYLFAAAAAVALASCSNDDFVGDVSPDAVENVDNGAIKFGFGIKNVTRADIGGAEAAKLLGSHFYVTGTKGTEAETSPTPTLVFDNYLVNYGLNTAGTTESNTANWEYVGVKPGEGADANYVKIGLTSSQTIKYWDYSESQYDFFAFSTGTKKAVKKTALTGTDAVAEDEIGVTAMKYGTGLASNAVAYTFYIPTVDAVKNAYITDITEVAKANYGKEVQLRFKNLGSKVRIALYETVPGYSVKDVKFYTEDGTKSDLSTATKQDDACLISADANGIPTKGEIQVYFPHVGDDNSSEQDYNVAATTVLPSTGSSVKTQGFGALTNQLVAKQESEETGNSKIYLGRNLPDASFAGDKDANYYQTVFPVSSPSALTLRVDYTLVSIDGSKEKINVYGAKAVVPLTYTKWLPNYAYTYIFKITDNTNGWTDTNATAQGLFPITFDAVVAEAVDATDEQTTITTVAAPTITTYQQNHDMTKDEYSIATGKDVYVQVMDNKNTPATLKADLNGQTVDNTARSLLYAVTGVDKPTEALVMDALQKRTTALDVDNVTGRNNVVLTKNESIDATVISIENGVDDNPITVVAGQAAKIGISSLTAGTYAYVYDYSDATKTPVTEFQPVQVTVGSPIGGTANTYKTLTTAALDAITTVTAKDENVDNAYIYFSKTKNGTATTTYSYISVAGKKTLPAGLIKVAKDTVTAFVEKTANAAAGTFYFDTYFVNDGKYAVKIIKIVA